MERRPQCSWSKGEAPLDRKQPLLLGDADGRKRPAVELKIIGFNTVAEDDAVLGHLRYDGHAVSVRDRADDNAGLGGVARERLAPQVVQIVGGPAECAALGRPPLPP